MTLKSDRKKRSFFSLGGVLLLTVIIGLAYLAFAKFSAKDPLLDDMDTDWQPTKPQISAPMPGNQPAVEPATDDSDFVSESAPPEIDERPPCQVAAADLENLYSRLDGHEYIKAYELEEDIQSHLNRLTIKLLNNPPNIGNETEDLFAILKNAAHFYRLLGAKDVSLVKDIMTYEREDLEEIMLSLYQWQVAGENCPDSAIKLSLPLEKLYDYSCYFLNTLGGQSYLFRRESRIRTLIKYYCILILDRADRAGLNKYGIDITYALESTMEDIETMDSLQFPNEYIHDLQEIKSRRLAQFKSVR